MNRRKFFKDALGISIASTIVPSLVSACKKVEEENTPEPSKFKGNVIIIGAGASGLYAAKTLLDSGIDFTILEADSRIGGRIKKIENFADFTIDLGAQWLHGKNTFLKKIADANNIGTYADNAEWVHRWYQGQFVSSFPQQYNDFKDMLNGEYIDLPDVSFNNYGIQHNYSSDIIKLLELPASTSGTSASRVSVRGYVEESYKWNYGNYGFWFTDSLYNFYDEVVISKVRHKVKLNSVVNKINYSGDKIKITTNDGNNYEADKVIITVAIPILKDGDINFVPALSNEKTEAFSKIGMGQGAKVFMKFNNRFYNGSILSGINGSKFVDAPYGKESNDNILLTSYFGERAEYFNTKTESEIVAELLSELDIMFNGAATQSYQGVIIQNWGKEPFIRGAYSYQTVGIGNAREVASSSVDNKLYFSGEAFHLTGAYQIIDGAAETGYLAAKEIINSR